MLTRDVGVQIEASQNGERPPADLPGLSHQLDYQKPSTQFMLEMFNILQKGIPLARAAGRKRNTVIFRKADTIRSFTAKDVTQKIVRKRVELSFQIPDLPKNEHLRLAEFRCKRSTSPSKKNWVKVIIFKGPNIARKVYMRVQAITQGEYWVFDISRAITAWFSDYKGEPFSIHIEIAGTSSNTPSQTTPKTQGYLLVFYLENRDFLKRLLNTYKVEEHLAFGRLGNVTSRGKRSVHDIKRGGQQKNRRWKKSGKKQVCRLYDFEVDFTTIGWGQWIIHPTRFNSKFCYGNCPSPIDMRLKPTNHAMLQSLMRRKRSNVAPAPCCVPTKLEPLSMMYLEDGEVVVRHHEDIIASECGCR
ncbi:nodal homolog [Haliotis asinina]|uniref:nodal homolog n=1 Tax=Haliotis asinina TaxID=109174 RepID=UPI0035325DA7